MDKYFCEQHQTKFFKKGNMKAYAHPLKDGEETIGWCNMPKEVPAVVKEAVKQGAVIVEEKMTKEDWSEKDLRTRKSIERQKALEIAERWCEEVIKTGTPVDTKQLLIISQRFEKYLADGE